MEFYSAPPQTPLPQANRFAKGFVSGALTEQAKASVAGTAFNESFFLQDASTGSGETVSNKVKVFDGKIFDGSTGAFPSGMGTGNYIIDLPNPEDQIIYAGVTFTPSTLALTSRFLGVSTSFDFPEARVDEDGGFLYYKLGFTYFAGSVFTIWQTYMGDISTELIYGAFAGQPALWAGRENGWLDLSSLFP